MKMTSFYYCVMVGFLLNIFLFDSIVMDVYANKDMVLVFSIMVRFTFIMLSQKCLYIFKLYLGTLEYSRLV